MTDRIYIKSITQHCARMRTTFFSVFLSSIECFYCRNRVRQCARKNIHSIWMKCKKCSLAQLVVQVSLASIHVRIKFGSIYEMVKAKQFFLYWTICSEQTTKKQRRSFLFLRFLCLEKYTSEMLSSNTEFISLKPKVNWFIVVCMHYSVIYIR